MLLLALDTSTPNVSVALADLGAPEDAISILAERDVVASNKHGELLAPLINQVFVESAMTRAQLGAVAVGLGPGPFTGLRVGIVTAAAIGDALGVPTYGECSLDVIAASHRRDAAKGPDFLVVTDARRRQVYWARYDASGLRVEGPDIAEPAALRERFAGTVTQVYGAGVTAHAEGLAGFEVDSSDLYPHARTLACTVGERASARAPSDSLKPLYLRRPDARPPSGPKRVTPA